MLDEERRRGGGESQSVWEKRIVSVLRRKNQVRVSVRKERTLLACNNKNDDDNDDDDDLVYVGAN